jgi:hypothetical protein
MQKIMVNYRQNRRRRLGRLLKSLLDVEETDMLRPNSCLMTMVMISYPNKCDQMKEFKAFWWGLD